MGSVPLGGAYKEEYVMYERQQSAPVKDGEVFDVTIEAVGEKGDGIAKKQGFVLFVPGTKQGERVKIRVTRVLKSVGFAEKIGEATTQADEPQAPPARQKPKEEEDNFTYDTSKDSEDFGDGEEDDKEEE
jgi:predicted RNA-binding protein with TRAM domain